MLFSATVLQKPRWVPANLLWSVLCCLVVIKKWWWRLLLAWRHFHAWLEFMQTLHFETDRKKKSSSFGCDMNSLNVSFYAALFFQHSFFDRYLHTAIDIISLEFWILSRNGASKALFKKKLRAVLNDSHNCFRRTI